MQKSNIIAGPKDLQEIPYDEELKELLLGAAHIGDISEDETFISYTSIVIAMLWSNDETSKWFHEFCERNNVNTSLIYKRVTPCSRSL
jgi:hypothetical protein